MNVILVGVNSKYSHTNLAIRLIKNMCVNVSTVEYTINQDYSQVASDLYLRSPDVIGFSCYIWNVEFIKKIVVIIRKILPKCIIFFGGPEAYNNAKNLLSYCDVIVCGEGEKIVPNLLNAIEDNNMLKNVAGICFLQDGRLITNREAEYFDLNLQIMPYNQDEPNRIIYYESSRGCPYRCSYCLSANDKVLRFRDVSLVFEDIKILLDRNVMQIKFIDRSFNCDAERSMQIWKFILENDNNFTGFHFEINAELLTDDMIDWLKTVRFGLFQFEIGLQSANPDTLNAINRKFDKDKMRKIVSKLSECKNIHLHLDLIAGLPFEDYNSFKQSFDYLYSLSPSAIQLGFLKVLSGSPLYEQIQQYKIVYNPLPPYELLSTKWLEYSDVIKLKRVEEAVEIFYNSGRFNTMLKLIVQKFSSPFEMFESIGKILLPSPIVENHNQMWYFEILNNIGLEHGISGENLSYACRYDICLNGRPKKFPDFAQSKFTKKDINNAIEKLSLSWSQIFKKGYADLFPLDFFDIEKGFELIIFDNN